MLELVGLSAVAGKTLRTYSLGMKQRLGLAGVLLGDPHTIILDEPANGLDPEGIRWIRDMLMYQAGLGKAVLVSSHLMSEMALMASALVVIGKGQLVDQTTVSEFVGRYGDQWVRAASPRVATLAEALRSGGARVDYVDDTTVTVHGATAAEVGEIAARHSVVLHELTNVSGSLEDAFLRATADVQEYQAGAK
jgi:ABC-2 type transport system ATP-binding protein